MSIFTVNDNTQNMEEGALKAPTFEDFSYSNGIVYWWASDFMEMLGYPNMASFSKPIHRAMQACLSAGIDCHDNFIKTDRVKDGITISDYKLTRFACYMVAMNGDTKKPEVGAAQVYFAHQAEQINLLLEGSNDVDRIVLRSEIKEGNKSLTSAAKNSGVKNYAIFMDSGYRGMYNMGIKQLEKKKGVAKDLFDHMGKTELSANWFRITMTEERLKNTGTGSEAVANNIHRKVGNDVRNMVKENTGLFPEQLPIERKLNEAVKELKKANKKLNSKK